MKQHSVDELYTVLSLLSFATRDYLENSTDEKLRDRLQNLINQIDEKYLEN